MTTTTNATNRRRTEWAAWLENIGGPEAIAAWRPAPFDPDVSEHMWIAIGDPSAEDPGIGATPAAAVEALNRWNVETLSDAHRAADADELPDGDTTTPLESLMWTVDGPEACALVRVEGSPDSLATLFRALRGGRPDDETLVAVLVEAGEERARDRAEAGFRDFVRLAKRPFGDLLSYRLTKSGKTPGQLAQLLEVPEATVCSWVNGATPDRRILPRLLDGLGALDGAR